MKSARTDLFPTDTLKVNDASNGEVGLSGNFSTPSARRSAVVSLAGSTPSVHPSTISSTNVRARNEARKLLSHVLLQLANRRKPPAVLDALMHATNIHQESSFVSLPLTMKKVNGIKKSQEDDSDDDEQQLFSTDDTINLVIQLEDVLATSVAQGWQIFEEWLVANFFSYRGT
jgi:hypothetical protein